MNWKCFFLGHELERMNIKIADGYPYFIDKCNRCILGLTLGPWIKEDNILYIMYFVFIFLGLTIILNELIKGR